MKPALIFGFFTILTACGDKDNDTGNNATTEATDTASDTEDTGQTQDTEDTGNTQDTEDTEDTEDTSDSGDSSDSGDTQDTEDTSDSGDTADTGDTGNQNVCDETDLIWSAVAMDANGTAQLVFPSSAVITLFGVVSNPCGNDIQFTTTSGCLISNGNLLGANPNTPPHFWAPMCTQAVTDWIVPAGSSLDAGEPVGQLTADSYTLSIFFANGQLANGNFEVNP